ncbi:hypothetical protein [Ensifer sp. SSB1]|uniref:hypothetical protein n=1 Tax=Ensifer sp. SSB1 TaxID=2795385 RepID=UPI001A501395|nr:hypothetical protein [Ensifer sp. SSB1]MBK5565493.1 hypothetical protein [Ensifer sp. SSB1]
MRTIAGAVAMAAAAILINASLGPERASASSTDGVRHPWAKVVVNHPPARHGAYYQGISQSAIPALKWPKSR